MPAALAPAAAPPAAPPAAKSRRVPAPREQTSPAAKPAPGPAWTPRPIPAGQVFRVSFVTYDQYVAVSDAFPDRNVFVTFIDGELQLMTTGTLHEQLKTAIDRLLIAADEVCDVPLACLGNVTLRDPVTGPGFEPDNCYYLDTDVTRFEGMTPEELPPPHLAVEVEVSETVLRRLPACAAKGVGELWRADGEAGLTFLRLDGGPGGEYREIAESDLLPGVTPALVWEAVTTVPRPNSTARYVRALAAFLADRLPAGE